MKNKKTFTLPPIKYDEFTIEERNIVYIQTIEKQTKKIHELENKIKCITKRNTNNKKLQTYSNELIELNATKDKFFSIIAHDLKNPFNGILGFSNLLEEDYNQLDDEERKLFIHQIKNAANTAYKLLENLLEWSRAQTGSLQWEPDYFDLSNIVNETILLLKEQAGSKEIRLVSFVPYNTIVYADLNMIKTVLRNFIQNSIKFTNRNGEIRIHCQADNKHITTTVKDNGIGINEEILKKLFKIDQKIISEGTEKERGTGLGLILCKEFIEKNGGTITLKSKEGIGSEFSFTIPTNT